MKTILFIFSFIFITIFLNTQAHAAPKQAGWGQCRGEIHMYCSEVKKGNDEGLISCLSKYKRKLSDHCDKRLTTVKESCKKKEKFENDHIPECNAEEKRYCQGVEPGNGRLKACLRLHKHKISEKCREALKKKSLFY
ncbi:MAG: cysteine-rich repeat-containing protein [uncultured bacterium]|nr:MAG: cysteine-rich repeat-containing protein [uncultured bacterium]